SIRLESETPLPWSVMIALISISPALVWLNQGTPETVASGAGPATGSTATETTGPASSMGSTQAGLETGPNVFPTESAASRVNGAEPSKPPFTASVVGTSI